VTQCTQPSAIQRAARPEVQRLFARTTQTAITHRFCIHIHVAHTGPNCTRRHQNVKSARPRCKSSGLASLMRQADQHALILCRANERRDWRQGPEGTRPQSASQHSRRVSADPAQAPPGTGTMSKIKGEGTAGLSESYNHGVWTQPPLFPHSRQAAPSCQIHMAQNAPHNTRCHQRGPISATPRLMRTSPTKSHN
jgi:hypothetical protein